MRIFVWQLSLTSRDDRPFPYGFGYHPYFTRHSPTMPSLTLPVSQEYTLVDALPDGPPSPLSDSVDFRQRRPVPDDAGFDHLFGGLDVAEPICLRYEQWHLEVQMHVDDVFTHAVLFSAPDGTLAVEPQTCATDAFNLAARGVEGTGMQVLSAGESVSAAVRLRVTAI
jgi:aldose 1-epimerase